MTSRTFATSIVPVCLLAAGVVTPAPLAAQDDPPPPDVQEMPVEDLVPPGLAEMELARSRACVPALARLAELDRDLQPLVGRAARLQALDEAVLLEDSTTVAAFDESDPLEAAVRDWFVADGQLGRRWAETRDTAIARQRDEGRAEIRQRIGEALAALDTQGQGRLSEAGDLQGDIAPCEGAILVRPAVLEVCDTLDSPVCEAAEESARPDTTAPGVLRFVDAPEDLWDVEEFRPWTSPTPLAIQPEGGLGGATTAARARRGNIVVTLALGPMVRDRTLLEPEQAEALEANLDSLGFTFDHPRLLFVPTFELQLQVAQPMGGETHYMLHFGDLSDPPSQVVWMGPVGEGGPVQAVFPANAPTLARMERGQVLSLTAVAVEDDPEEGTHGEAVYSIALSNVYQEGAVGGLLQYWAGGQMSEDLRRLVPPDTASGGS